MKRTELSSMKDYKVQVGDTVKICRLVGSSRDIDSDPRTRIWMVECSNPDREIWATESSIISEA